MKDNNIYTIKTGDSFWKLENEWGLPYGTLQKLNPKVNPRKLKVGQKIKIPIVNLIVVLEKTSIRKTPYYIDKEQFVRQPIDNLRVHQPLGFTSGVGNVMPNSNSHISKGTPTKVSPDFFSDIWNSPIGRMHVPDKISISLSSSATAFLGVSTDMSFHFITRGHDASLIPYTTFTVGGQAGPQVSADALVGVSIGYYSVADMRNLKKEEAKKALLGWNIYGSVDAGLGLGGSITGSVGFSKLPLVSEPTWVDIGISGGASIGGGVTGGTSYSLPVFKNQFK